MSATALRSTPSIDVRGDFPLLAGDIVYLDSGASTQKPNAVIEAVDAFYRSGYANIHRGVYRLSEQATARYEATRRKVQHYIGAASDREMGRACLSTSRSAADSPYHTNPPKGFCMAIIWHWFTRLHCHRHF